MSRAAILAKVRAGLKVERGGDIARRASVEARLAGGGSRLVPARGEVGGEERVALFKSFLAAQGTDVIEIDEAGEIPISILGYLEARGLALRVRTGSDPLFAALPWTKAPSLARGAGAAEPDDRAGLSRALAGVAETGRWCSPPVRTIRRRSRCCRRRTSWSCGARRSSAPMRRRSLWSRASWARPELPHTLNLISGASRTGDIGGRIVMGAHGPRRLAVILLGGN